MRVIVLGVLALLVMSGVAMVAQAAEKGPTDFRRTTLIVRDINASLKLYRDALGMSVYYDQELTSPNLQRAGSDGKNRSRLVLLKANDGFIGLLGLWQFLDAPNAPARAKPAFAPNEIVMVFNANDFDDRFPKVKATPGVAILSEPALRIYPGPGGTEIRVMVSMVTDPDGYIVELNKALSALPGQK